MSTLFRSLEAGIFIFSAVIPAFAQILEPSQWAHETSKTDVKAGEEVELIFTSTIDKDWYLYSSDFDPDCGPMVTTFAFEPHDSYELVGDLRAIDPIEKFDDVFECNVRIFKKNGTVPANGENTGQRCGNSWQL